MFKYQETPFAGWQTTSESAAEALAEFSGRLCYLSFGEGEMDGHKTVKGRTNHHEYLQNILRVKHGSVIEHPHWSLLIEGVSRSLTHELVRHRHFSYSQLSQRYVDESQVAFVLPPELERYQSWPDDPHKNPLTIWKTACEAALHDYRSMLRLLEADIASGEGPMTVARKRARQTARSVLPNCVETKVVMTGNARAWRHFLTLRGSKAAETEIRRLAIEIWRLLNDEAPAIFGDFTIEDGELLPEYTGV